MNPYNKHWVPKYKSELISWLNAKKGYKIYRLRKRTLNELYAMYFTVRKNEESSMSSTELE